MFCGCRHKTTTYKNVLIHVIERLTRSKVATGHILPLAIAKVIKKLFFRQKMGSVFYRYPKNYKR